MGSGIFSQPHREAIRSLDHTGALKLSKVNYVLPCDSNMALTFFFGGTVIIYTGINSMRVCLQRTSVHIYL